MGELVSTGEEARARAPGRRVSRAARGARAPATALLAVLIACEGNPTPKESREARETAERELPPELDGPRVDPPFDVRGDCKGLLLVWFDREGAHKARSRSEIPEAHRRLVRVTSLELPPDRRPDPDRVYVADLREVGSDGSYAVRKVRRAAFEARVEAAQDPETERAGSIGKGGAGVIVYGAEWCGACDEVAHFFERHQVPFVEKDIEENPAARKEMKRKARRAGIRPGGIPIIDFRGTLVQGFNRKRLRKLMKQGTSI